jgi:diguanylate cyclase (GGDEF)-like protein
LSPSVFGWPDDNKNTLTLVFYIDVDNLKYINNLFGHSVGDILLRQVGRILKDLFRDSFSFEVYRIAGDEFAVCKVGLHKTEEINFLAKSIIKEFEKPISIGEHIISASVSIGISRNELCNKTKCISCTEAYEKLNFLRGKNISIALDDFGTGYSSLTYSKALPITTVKLDKSFIDDIATDELSLKIVENVMQIAKNIGLKIVVEGVETFSYFTLPQKPTIEHQLSVFLMLTDTVSFTFLKRRNLFQRSQITFLNLKPSTPSFFNCHRCLYTPIRARS